MHIYIYIHIHEGERKRERERDYHFTKEDYLLCLVKSANGTHVAPQAKFTFVRPAVYVTSKIPGIGIDINRVHYDTTSHTCCRSTYIVTELT